MDGEDYTRAKSVPNVGIVIINDATLVSLFGVIR